MLTRSSSAAVRAGEAARLTANDAGEAQDLGREERWHTHTLMTPTARADRSRPKSEHKRIERAVNGMLRGSQVTLGPRRRTGVPASGTASRSGGSALYRCRTASVDSSPM